MLNNIKSMCKLPLTAVFIFTFSFLNIFSQIPTKYQKKNLFNKTYYEGVKYFFENDFNSAEKYFKEALEYKPGDTNTLLYLAELSIAQLNFNKVEFYSKIILEIIPDNFDATLNLGVIYLNKGELKKAESLLLKALNVQPNNENVLFNLAVLYANKGNYDSAIESLQKTIELNPNTGIYYQTLGLYYLIQNKYDKAENIFLKSLKIDNTLLESRKGLVIIYQNRIALESAAKYLNELESLEPDMMYLNLLKAVQNYLKGDINAAIQFANKEINMYPMSPDGYYLLSDLYSLTDNKSKAGSIFSKAEKLMQQDGTAPVYSLINIKNKE